MAIVRFREQYQFLSSMYPVTNGVETQDGIQVASVEIGYQADKFDDYRARARVLNSGNGYEAKRLSRMLTNEGGLKEREDWAEKKLGVMQWYVHQKFGRNPDVAEKLVDTHPQTIVEGNTWGDTYWGARPLKQDGLWLGQNNLGNMLMTTRLLLLEGIDLVHENSTISAQKESPLRTWGPFDI